MRWRLLSAALTFAAVIGAVAADDARPLVAPLPTIAEIVDPKPGVDPAVVAAGREAFANDCVGCHDAERSTSERRTLDDWRSVATRMSQKQGASIPAGDIEGIAAYLASLCPPSAVELGDKPAHSSFTPFAAISPVWRGGSPNLQDGGFFPEAFIGVQWQQKNGPLSIRATACTACHCELENDGMLQRIELVEAVVRVETSNICPGCPGVKAALEAGRFVVPFGAFASQVNPGVYRTVSKPLIFNMGMRVHEGDLGDPVLPMPYSDEGAVVNFTIPFGESNLNATVDAYVVNGLIGNESGVDFDASRAMIDNNNSPATGGRLTFGNQWVRAGGSVMGGRFNDRPIADGSYGRGMQYFLWGVDISAHYSDIIRVQAEYAHRGNDHVLVDDTGAFLKSWDRVGGAYIEAEGRVSEGSPVSVLVRYDRQSRRDAAAPDESVLPEGHFAVSRVTCGLNFQLFHRSLLMLNEEHWLMPTGLHNADVLGVRYVVTF